MHFTPLIICICTPINKHNEIESRLGPYILSFPCSLCMPKFPKILMMVNDQFFSAFIADALFLTLVICDISWGKSYVALRSDFMDA